MFYRPTQHYYKSHKIHDSFIYVFIFNRIEYNFSKRFIIFLRGKNFFEMNLSTSTFLLHQRFSFVVECVVFFSYFFLLDITINFQRTTMVVW